MTDMERMMAAADALAVAMSYLADPEAGEIDRNLALIDARTALTAYRAAREAVTRGTPPAFATSA